MKRIFTLILAMVFSVSITACSSTSNSEIEIPSDVTTGNSANDSQQGVQETQTSEQEDTEVTINETVLVNESGVKITAKSLDHEGFYGPEIKLLIENNSGSNLTFQGRNASVNGYMVETIMSADVSNGKKANDGLTFSRADLEACGIDEIADMEFSFHIFNTESWDSYLDTEKFQLKTSIYDTFEYIYDDSGNLAYDGNGVRIVIKGLDEDGSLFGPSIIVYVENNGEKDITAQVRDVSINGFMVDSVFSCDVTAGKHAIDTITFLESDIEENSIAEINDVELSFHIFDFNEWETIADTEPVKITF